METGYRTAIVVSIGLEATTIGLLSAHLVLHHSRQGERDHRLHAAASNNPDHQRT